MHMNSVDRTFDEGGRNDPDQPLDRLLAQHRTRMNRAVADALDTRTGLTALTPLRRELFHGIQPLSLPPSTDGTDSAHTEDSTDPPNAAWLEGILTRLQAIGRMAERIQDGAGSSDELRGRTQAVTSALQCLHAGLQARDLTEAQVRTLFRTLRDHSAGISTTLLGPRPQLHQHVVEAWLRAAASLKPIEVRALRLFRDAGESVPTQG
ncbi:hypothetical protein ACIPSE_28970 [Streptomyces sp. NPDC090106]|uniref:hypothetical protein n=1 Tax=Streptomyces sp. NPDC090106 TaxID=3365946 RepID=UPI00382FC672